MLLIVLFLHLHYQKRKDIVSFWSCTTETSASPFMIINIWKVCVAVCWHTRRKKKLIDTFSPFQTVRNNFFSTSLLCFFGWKLFNFTKIFKKYYDHDFNWQNTCTWLTKTQGLRNHNSIKYSWESYFGNIKGF